MSPASFRHVKFLDACHSVS